MAQRIVAWDDTTDRLIRTTKDPADVGTASDTGERVNAGSESITSGATSKAVTFVNAFSNTLYGIVAQLSNTVDGTVQYQPVTITSKSSSGFTAKFNAPTDSANYNLEYIAVDPCITYRGGRESLSASVSEATIAMFLASGHSILSQLHNDTDSTPLFQPVVLTIQETDQDAAVIPTFRNTWNVDTDSANYDLEFVANNVACSTAKAFVEDLTNGSTTKTINFPYFDMESNTYAVIARFQNTVDPSTSVLLQPTTITNKTVSSFTVKWNVPVDSANYRLEWIANVVTTA